MQNFSYNPWTVQNGNAFYNWENVTSSLIDNIARADGWRLPNGSDFTDLMSVVGFYDEMKFIKTGRYDSNPVSYDANYSTTYYYSLNGVEVTGNLRPGLIVNNLTKECYMSGIHHDFGFLLRLVKNVT